MMPLMSVCSTFLSVLFSWLFACQCLCGVACLCVIHVVLQFCTCILVSIFTCAYIAHTFDRPGFDSTSPAKYQIVF